MILVIFICSTKWRLVAIHLHIIRYCTFTRRLFCLGVPTRVPDRGSHQDVLYICYRMPFSHRPNTEPQPVYSMHVFPKHVAHYFDLWPRFASVFHQSFHHYRHIKEKYEEQSYKLALSLKPFTTMERYGYPPYLA